MDYIMESIKNTLGENSIGWRRVKKNQDLINELKDFLKQKEEYQVILEKIQELE